jgi:hypothetical protein
MVLDGVSHLLLLMTRGANLRFDLLKLDWSPLLPDLSGTDARALQDALEDIGPQRVVLHHVDNEAAMRWGLMYGIRKFQGRHIEAILGASRMKSCPLAAGCTARQCIERAAATGVFGRSGCGNTVLLDAGHDPDAAARATLDTGPGPRSAPRASAGGQNMAAPT